MLYWDASEPLLSNVLAVVLAAAKALDSNR